MFTRIKLSLVVAILLFSVYGCAPETATPIQSATASSVPPTVTLAPTVTKTYIPPTITLTPTLTPSEVPPTATPAPPTPTATFIAESSFDGVRVTYITNAGFLITAGDRRILIDGIYQGYPGGVLKPILESQPPFDGVDLILITHEHPDHFDAELVLQYLQDNPETKLVSTPRVIDSILAIDGSVEPRLTAIDLKHGEQKDLRIADIDLEAFYISHGMPGLLNLGFVIIIDNITIFHTGDIVPTSVSVSDLKAYGLPQKHIDIAFVPEFLFSEEDFHAHILEGIQARYLIPMHFDMQPASGFESVFTNIHVFTKPYESWIMP